MNRRSFLDSLIKAGVGFTILPAATTYTRHWSGIVIPRPPSFGAVVFIWTNGRWVKMCNMHDMESLKTVLKAYQDLNLPTMWDLPTKDEYGRMRGFGSFTSSELI